MVKKSLLTNCAQLSVTTQRGMSNGMIQGTKKMLPTCGTLVLAVDTARITLD